MIKEYMESLKKELSCVAEVIKNHKVFDIEYLNLNHDVDFMNGFDYFVVLRDGTFFYIVLGSYIFPEIDINDILYIRKGRGLSVSDFYKTPEFFDTEVGNFNCEDIIDHDVSVMKCLGFDRTKRICTGGYD